MKLCMNNLFFTSAFFGILPAVSADSSIGKSEKLQPFPRNLNNLEQPTAPNKCINGKKWISLKEYYETNEEIEEIVNGEMNPPTYFSKEKDWVKVCQRFEAVEEKDESHMEQSGLPVVRQTSTCTTGCYNCCGCQNICRPISKPQPPSVKPPPKKKTKPSPSKEHKKHDTAPKKTHTVAKKKPADKPKKKPCFRRTTVGQPGIQYLRTRDVDQGEFHDIKMENVFLCHNWKQVTCDNDFETVDPRSMVLP